MPSRRNGLPTLAIERITPEIANDLLQTNKSNRHIRDRRVDQYARDMETGNWHPVGEPLAITPEGRLLNGQHRLLAIVKADKAVDLPVMRNVPKHFQDSMDHGLKRGFSDILKLHYGEQNVSPLSAAVKQVHQYRAIGIMGRTGGHHPATSATTAELVATYEAEPNLRNSLPVMWRVRGHGQWFAPGLMTALHYVFSEVDPDEADAFFGYLATGEELPRGSAILALRKLGVRRPMDLGPQVQAAVIIKAFNYWRADRSINTGNLRWRAGGSSPEAFPRILTPEEIDRGQSEAVIEEEEAVVA